MIAITDDIHLVMSGALGLDLTDPLDCNAYLIETSEGWLLFDAGAGRSVDGVVEGFTRSGLDPARGQALFLTHGHADHSAGAARLHELTGLSIIAGAATAFMVERGDEDAISLTSARAAGGYPPDFSYRRCPVDRHVADRERLVFGDTEVTAIATPGHSHDHFAFLVRRNGRVALIAGDALFHGGRVGVQDIYDCSVPQICATVRRLAGLDYDIFLPGHGAFSLRNGRRHAQAALAYVERKACPPSI